MVYYTMCAIMNYQYAARLYILYFTIQIQEENIQIVNQYGSGIVFK